jgi:hypothetical protein
VPDRIIRDELLTSDRWISLKDNGDRLAFLACLLTVDTLGNMEASNGQLRRLWRDFGINTDQLIAKTLTELLEHDLARPYDIEGKRFLHLPRFKQTRRWLGRICPLSPWTSNEDKQRVENYSHGARTAQAPSAHRAHLIGVGVGVGVGVERRGVGVGVQRENANEPAEGQNLLIEKTAKTNPIRPDETLEDYRKRLEAIAASIVKPIPK